VKRQFELRSPADRFDPPTHYLPRHAFGGHLVPGEGATGLRMDGRGVLRRRRRGGRRRTARGLLVGSALSYGGGVARSTRDGALA